MSMKKIGAGERLRNWRIEQGLSLEEVSNMISFSTRSIVAWEHGERLPGYDAILSIAGIMHVSTDWLLGRTDDRRMVVQISSDLEASNRKTTSIPPMN